MLPTARPLASSPPSRPPTPSAAMKTCAAGCARRSKTLLSSRLVWRSRAACCSAMIAKRSSFVARTLPTCEAPWQSTRGAAAPRTSASARVGTQHLLGEPVKGVLDPAARLRARPHVAQPRLRQARLVARRQRPLLREVRLVERDERRHVAYRRAHELAELRKLLERRAPGAVGDVEDGV